MNWIREEAKYIFQTYKRQPLVLVKGKGSYVWDEKGKKYLDFFSGLGVNAFGQTHPVLFRALIQQAKKLGHTSNIYFTQPQIECARLLVEKTFPAQVFFSNSGAEAGECAIKLARRFGKEKSPDAYEIISFENSFHGRTMGTLTLTGQEKFRKGFDPLLSKVLYAKFNDSDSVKKLISPKTSAIIVEPVQGEGGVRPAKSSFLKLLREICDKNKILLIFDEVQCGLGRSGALFCFQHYGVVPDVLTLAKALGGGLPIGATLAKPHVAALLSGGDHASTFGGNPLVCAVATQVLKLLDKKLLKSVQEKSAYLISSLEKLKQKFPNKIKEIRGLGLMMGLELTEFGDGIVNGCRENGLLINCTQGNILRFLPPLNISKKEIDEALSVLQNEIRK